MPTKVRIAIGVLVLAVAGAFAIAPQGMLILVATVGVIAALAWAGVTLILWYCDRDMDRDMKAMLRARHEARQRRYANRRFVDDLRLEMERERQSDRTMP